MNKQILAKLLTDTTALQVYGWLFIHQDELSDFKGSEVAKELKINRFTFQSVLNRLETHHKLITKTSHKECVSIMLIEQQNRVIDKEVITNSSQTHHTNKEKKESSKESKELYISSLRSETQGQGKVEEFQKEKPEKSLIQGHPYREIIAYCREKQGIKEQYVNYVKQTVAVKRILSSGYSLNDVRFVIDEMSVEEFWKSSPFDLMNVANNMHKYMNRIVMFKKKGDLKGGRYAYN